MEMAFDSRDRSRVKPSRIEKTSAHCDTRLSDDLMGMSNLGERGVGRRPCLEKCRVGFTRARFVAGEFADTCEAVEGEAGVGTFFERVFVGGFGPGVVFGADEREGFVLRHGTDVKGRLPVSGLLLFDDSGCELFLSLLEPTLGD